MKSTQLLASFAAVSLLCWAAGCSSDSGDDNHNSGGSAGKGGSGNNGGNGGNAAGSAGTGDTGNAEGGVPAEGGTGSEVSDGGDTTSMAGMTGEAGGGATCATNVDFDTDGENCGRCEHSCGGGECIRGECQLVVVLDPDPRTIPANNVLDLGNAVLVDQGNIFYWNYGYPPNVDYQYTILKASVVPTTPPSNGLPAVQTLIPTIPGPILGATFNAGYLYYSLKTGATTAEVHRKKLDTSDGTGDGPKAFSLDNSRLWQLITISGNTAYLTGEVDQPGTIMVDLIKTGIYKITLPPANSDVKAVPIAGLENLDNRIFDLTVVGSHLFWLQYDEATVHPLVWTAPVAGGVAPTMLDDTHSTGGTNITADPDGTYVYWNSHFHGGSLVRCPVATPDQNHIEQITEVNNGSEGLFIDDTYAYYMEDETLVDGKPIWRVKKAGGSPELLGQLPGGTALVGVDDGFVYAQDFDSVLYRVAKTP